MISLVLFIYLDQLETSLNSHGLTTELHIGFSVFFASRDGDPAQRLDSRRTRSRAGSWMLVLMANHDGTNKFNRCIVVSSITLTLKSIKFLGPVIEWIGVSYILELPVIGSCVQCDLVISIGKSASAPFPSLVLRSSTSGDDSREKDKIYVRQMYG